MTQNGNVIVRPPFGLGKNLVSLVTMSDIAKAKLSTGLEAARLPCSDYSTARIEGSSRKENRTKSRGYLEQASLCHLDRAIVEDGHGDASGMVHVVAWGGHVVASPPPIDHSS